MNNPRTSAIVSAVAVVLLGYSIFGATEAPSSTRVPAYSKGIRMQSTILLANASASLRP